MMDDRFASDLRRHLVRTADERPADGQLAAIVDAVAVTPQRHPLGARLTWIPGRIGPIPTRALRYGLLAAALIALTVGAALVVGALLSHPSTIFEGTWTSVDAGDGSTMTLAVSQGAAPAVRFVDEHASGEACLADAVKVFTADGTGVIDGNRLAVVWPDGGGCGSMTVAVGPGTYTYDQATDRIVDGQKLTWRRVQGAPGLPTQDPSATARPTPSSEPAWCSDVPAGTTYSSVVGALSLTVTIPARTRLQWQGIREEFALAGYCFSGGPVGIRAVDVTTVAAACDADDWVDVSSPAEAVAALANAPGLATSKQTSLTLGGHPATRFELAADARMCFDQVLLWNDFIVRRGSTTTIYLVDVDGRSLGIAVVNPRDEASAAERAEAEAILASLQIAVVPGPHPSSAPMAADPGCIQFNGTGTYTALVGPLSVSATVPDGPGTYWSGSRYSFRLLRSPCPFDAPVTFEGSVVTQVPLDACHWEGPGTDVANAAAAAAALAGQAGTDAAGQTELTIDGHPAVRLRVSLASDFDLSPCDGGGTAWLWPIPDGDSARIQEGETVTVYLVDVEGSILAINEKRPAGDEVEIPTLRAEIDEIIGSLQIEP